MKAQFLFWFTKYPQLPTDEMDFLTKLVCALRGGFEMYDVRTGVYFPDENILITEADDRFWVSHADYVRDDRGEKLSPATFKVAGEVEVFSEQMRALAELICVTEAGSAVEVKRPHLTFVRDLLIRADRATNGALRAKIPERL